MPQVTTFDCGTHSLHLLIASFHDIAVYWGQETAPFGAFTIDNEDSEIDTYLVTWKSNIACSIVFNPCRCRIRTGPCFRPRVVQAPHQGLGGMLHNICPFAQHERWQTAYLPVYAALAAFVVVVFPPVFGLV